MSYALQTLWHERQRYASGVFAVTFSAVLIALQCGLLLGLFKITSIPIDYTSADIWVGSQAVQSVDLGKPIPESYLTRVDGTPGVRSTESYIANFANFTKPTGGTELCFLLGSSLDDDSAGAARVLTPEQRVALTETDAIIVDESDVKRLGMDGTGEGKPKINGKEIKLVGTVKGLKSLAAPWIFCSQTTARRLLSYLLPPEHITYLLLKCDSPERAKQVAAGLREQYPDMSVATAEDFSTGSRWYWLTRTKAGIAIGFAALLGLFVGAVITYQTLRSATMASAKEFAILLALGIPRWRISWMVLTQSFWVGMIGIATAYPICLLLQLAARQVNNTEVDLRIEVLAGTAIVTLVTALLSGTVALGSVRKIEPMDLLR
jgi:putative ABC transport system permease protein